LRALRHTSNTLWRFDGLQITVFGWHPLSPETTLPFYHAGVRDQVNVCGVTPRLCSDKAGCIIVVSKSPPWYLRPPAWATERYCDLIAWCPAIGQRHKG
jgi:hypothetical protein